MYVFGPSGFWTMAPLRYTAKFAKFCHLETLPVVADNGPAPVIDLGFDLGIVPVTLAVVLGGLAEDGVTVAHEGDLDVAGVFRGACKL